MKVLVALVTDYVDWLGDCVNIIYQLAVRIQRSDAYRCRDLTFVKLLPPLCIVRMTDLQIWGIGTKEVNRLQYDFLLALYLKCPKIVDGPLHHFAKCHFKT